MNKKINSKYKKGDVLITRMGKIFTVVDVQFKEYSGMISPGSGPGPEVVYLLKKHGYPELPARYLDTANHITWATEAAQLIYGQE